MHISEMLHLTLYVRMEPDILIIIARNWIYMCVMTAVSVIF